ncbi:TMEM175 family protein [Pedobacter aquatilis]|uniref:TMEM175 family protein n=1 Tax=Pedobacter aquatilis TaxID=351343 RepID=UPI00292EC727|nr:TMEM175 family protein [Pedobacter aquatilis]
MKRYDQLAGQNISRLEFLSDGVFAISITLLILDIKVPLSSLIHNEADLISSFLTLSPRLLAYFLSFLTLGIFWTGQSSEFQYINKSDRNLIWINLFLLLCVSIIPFTTAFLSEYMNFRFAVIVYWFNIFLIGLMLYLNWTYADRKGLLKINRPDKARIDRAIKNRIIFGQAFYFIGSAMCFINTYLSIGIIFLVQLNYALGLFTRRTNAPEQKAIH